ncbi:MAG TPA: hypothetical protein VF636_04835 [Sphingomonas sp.]
MSQPRRFGAVLLAGLAFGVSTQGCSMPPQCFSKRAGYVFPTPERVRPHLSHGEAGRRLYDAVTDGDRDRAVAMLRADPALAGLAVEYDRRGDRPDGQAGDLLAFAVTNCDPAMLAALLEAGVPPDGADPGRALGYAMLADDPGMAETLLRAGASPDPQKRGGANVFSDVAADGNLGGAMMLVRHGLDQRWVDRFGSGHLEAALRMERFAIAEELVKAGAPLWRVSLGGRMPVHALTDARILDDPSQDAARLRLIERAKATPLPWPPPPPADVLAKFVSGEWPSAAMRAAGLDASPEVVAMLRERAGAE